MKNPSNAKREARRWLTFAGVALSVAVSAGCGTNSAPENDGGARGAPESGTEAAVGLGCPAWNTAGSVVSFATDVVPLLVASCAFRGCHDGTSRTRGLFLGPSADEPPVDAAVLKEIHESLLAPAVTTADIPRVKPFEPSQSLLLLKVQGCQNGAGLTCTGTANAPCGAQMPDLSTPLVPDRVDLLARWIAQGAAGADEAGSVTVAPRDL